MAANQCALHRSASKPAIVLPSCLECRDAPDPRYYKGYDVRKKFAHIDEWPIAPVFQVTSCICLKDGVTAASLGPSYPPHLRRAQVAFCIREAAALHGDEERLLHALLLVRIADWLGLADAALHLCLLWFETPFHLLPVLTSASVTVARYGHSSAVRPMLFQ